MVIDCADEAPSWHRKDLKRIARRDKASSCDHHNHFKTTGGIIHDFELFPALK